MLDACCLLFGVKDVRLHNAQLSGLELLMIRWRFVGRCIINLQLLFVGNDKRDQLIERIIKNAQTELKSLTDKIPGVYLSVFCLFGCLVSLTSYHLS